MSQFGPLAFVGGGEWREGCTFDRALLDASEAEEVLVLPTAAAYEHPERAVAGATEWFASHGAKVRSLDVLNRRDAEDAALADVVRNARFVYLADGSPLHLRSVLKDSLLWRALHDAWKSGAAIAGSAAGAMVFGDPMVDPRGGAFTLGLGLVRRLAVVPHWERWTNDKARRMTHLMPSNTVVAEIEERTALIRWGDGTWQVDGSGRVTLTLDHENVDVNAIEAAVERS
jgi:cyanophycinase